MPRYKYALTNGKFLVLEGDTQPSDADAAQIAAQMKVTLVPAETSPEAQAMRGMIPQSSFDGEKAPARPAAAVTAGPFDTSGFTGDFLPGPTEFGKRLVNAAVDAGVGAVKGAANTAIGLGELTTEAARHIPGLRDLPLGSPEEFARARAAVATPSNTMQGAGKFAEQSAEFLLPQRAGISVLKAPGIINALARGGAAGLGAGVVGATQAGDVRGATVPAIIGAALPVAGAVAQETASRTLYPAVKTAVKEGGAIDKFFKGVSHPEEGPMFDLTPSEGPVAGKLAENLDEALRQVRELGLTGGRSDSARIIRWAENKLQELLQSGRPSHNIHAISDLKEQEKLLHALSDELAAYEPNGSMLKSLSIPGVAGYLLGGLKSGGLTAAADLARRNYPAIAATWFSRLSDLLDTTAARGAAGGAASSIQQELLKREMQK